MTHCRKSHNTAHVFCVIVQGDTFCMLGNLACFLLSAEFFFELGVCSISAINESYTCNRNFYTLKKLFMLKSLFALK